MLELPLIRFVNGYLCLWMSELQLARHLVDPATVTPMVPPQPGEPAVDPVPAPTPAPAVPAGVDVRV
jgi:hypothetical protein